MARSPNFRRLQLGLAITAALTFGVTGRVTAPVTGPYGSNYGQTVNADTSLQSPGFYGISNTRGGTAAQQHACIDQEGRSYILAPNEVWEPGKRRVQNRIVGSSRDFTNAAWTKAGLGPPAGPVATANQAVAPDGTLTASKLVYPAVSGANAYSVAYQNRIVSAAGTTVYTAWMLGAVGGEVIYLMVTPDGTNYVKVACTLSATVWQRFALPTTDTPGANFFQIGVDLRDTTQTAKAAQTIYIWETQDESTVGQSNRNPSEYASVGVTSSPIYNGASADGVLHLNTENGNTVTNNVVTAGTGRTIVDGGAVRVEFGSGNYMSAPAGIIPAITASLEYRVVVNFSSTATAARIFNQWHAGTLGVSRFLDIWTFSGNTASISFNWVDAGGTSRSAAALTNVPITFGVDQYFRVTFALATGQWNLYSSSDNGVTWVLAGNQPAAFGLTTMAATGTSLVNFGSSDTGAAGTFPGSAKFLQCFADGIKCIDLSIPRDFPSLVTGAKFATSKTTGEVWTLQGNARVYYNNAGGYGMGWRRGQAITNVLRSSGDVSNGTYWSSTAGLTFTSNAGVGVDGSLSAQKLAESAGNVQHYVLNTIGTTPSVAYTAYAFLKAGERNWALVQMDNNTANFGSNVWFNLATGTVGTINNTGYTAALTGTTAKMVPLGNGWWICAVSFTAPATTAINTAICTASADATVSYAGVVGSGIYFSGAQLALGSTISAYVPTTTAAVTCAADLMSFAAAGKLNTLNGWWFIDGIPQATIASGARFIDTGSGALFASSTGNISMSDGSSTLNLGTSYVPGVRMDIAGYWRSSDLKMNVGKDTLLGVAATFDGTEGGGATAYLGSDPSGTNDCDILIKRLKMGVAAITDSILKTLTVPVALPMTDNRVLSFRAGMAQIASGGKLSTWGDLTGLGHDLTQATGTKQFVLNADGTATSDGVDDFMQTPAFTLVQPETPCLKFKFLSVNAVSQAYICDGGTQDRGTLYFAQAPATGTAIGLYAGAGSLSATFPGTGVYASVIGLINGASSSIKVGSVQATVTGAAGANNMGGFTIGGAGNGISTFSNTQYAAGDLYNIALDTATQIATAAYYDALAFA